MVVEEGYKIFDTVTFLDIFDLDTIQKLQDSFAYATGVASIITDPDGVPITKPSNFCRLCNDIIRKTEKGLKNCYYSDAQLGKPNKKGPNIEKCLSGGLWDAGASIFVGEKHIANWMVGQVKNAQTNEEKILSYAKEIGANEQEFREALGEVNQMTSEQFKKVVDSLYIFANELSEKAYKNLLLRIHKENLEFLVKEKTEELEAANEELRATIEELYDKNIIIEKQNEELKITLHTLGEAQEQLLQSDKMASLGFLTAGIAHEINNPLNFILNSKEVLQEYFDKYGSHDDETTSLILQGLEEGAMRVANIVKGLNQYSRNNEMLNENCDIHAILENSLLILHNKIKYNIAIVKDYCNTYSIIKGNVGKIHQVFVNIINNSVDAIAEKDGTGEIIISTRNDGEYVFIEVTDNGCGIEKDVLSSITDPFFTTKPPGEGTGLGLSISSSIIKEHQGELIFESIVGEKTVAKIKFPVSSK